MNSGTAKHQSQKNKHPTKTLTKQEKPWHKEQKAKGPKTFLGLRCAERTQPLAKDTLLQEPCPYPNKGLGNAPGPRRRLTNI